MGRHAGDPGRGERRPDLYALLGVRPDATAAEITRAYRRLVRALHPDTGPGRDPDALARVLAAYQVLGDARLRADYDEQPRPPVEHPEPGPPGRPAGGGPVPIPVRVRRAPPSTQPPLRAGPVRWYPARPGG